MIFKKVKYFYDQCDFEFKTKLLILIIAGGMLSMVFMAMISTYSMKYDFDKIFEYRTQMLVKLEKIKDAYKVNMQDTLFDRQNNSINTQQAHEVISHAQQLIQSDWKIYQNTMDFSYEPTFYITGILKRFLHLDEHSDDEKMLKKRIINNINNKMQTINQLFSEDKWQSNTSQLYFEISAINIYLTSLIHYDLSLAVTEKNETQQVFSIIVIASAISIILIFLFSVILSMMIVHNFKILHNQLEEKVEAKTMELRKLNESLEQRVQKELKNSRKKDLIMIQQAKFASLGEMLNNIAHQWRQPLGAISMIIQGFQTKNSFGKLTDAYIDEKVEDALLLADNMSNTLDDFKNFFNPSKSKEKFLIQECVEHAFELSKYILENNAISYTIHVRNDTEILSYYNELSQVLLNLISNSKDALCKNLDQNRNIKVAINHYNHKVIINFIDNGGGISDEVAPKIFEPYFTTKYKSAGTGIGLYMSKQIIQRHILGTITHKNIRHKIDNKTNYQCSLFIINIPISQIKETDEL